jgi:hypothetical protein
MALRIGNRALAKSCLSCAIVFWLAPGCALASDDAAQGASEHVGKPAATGAPDCGAAEMASGSAEFAPADREIFFEDFSQTEVGGFPARWTLKGPGGGGNPLSVVSRDGSKFLFSQTPPEGEEQTSSTVYVRLPKLKDLAETFTIEFDAVFGYSRLATDLQAEKQYDVRIGADDSSFSLLAVSSERVISRNTQSALSLADGNVHHVALSVNGRFVTAYVDGRCVISDPEGADRPIARVGLELSTYKRARQDDLMFTRFRIAEAGRQKVAR